MISEKALPGEYQGMACSAVRVEWKLVTCDVGESSASPSEADLLGSPRSRRNGADLPSELRLTIVCGD